MDKRKIFTEKPVGRFDGYLRKSLIFDDYANLHKLIGESRRKTTDLIRDPKNLTANHLVQIGYAIRKTKASFQLEDLKPYIMRQSARTTNQGKDAA